MLSNMSIDEILEKIKPFYNLILILIVAGIFFFIGRLYSLEKQNVPIKVEYINATNTASVINTDSSLKTNTLSSAKNTPPPIPTDGPVIGSKSGKKYYFPWCGTVKRIKPENQVHFGSIAEAKSAGFIPGGNCKGLK